MTPDAGQPGGRSIVCIAYAALPIFPLMVTTVAIIAAFPEIVTWLPQQALARG